MFKKTTVFILTLLLITSAIMVVNPTSAMAASYTASGYRDGNIAVNNGWPQFKSDFGLGNDCIFYSFGSTPSNIFATSQTVRFNSSWQVDPNGQYYFTVKLVNLFGWWVTGWESNFNVDFVFVKAGSGYNWFQYDPPATQDGGLPTPTNKWGISLSLSHFAFAFCPPKTVNKTVTKIWSDGNDQDGLRSDAVTVQLKANGQDYGQSVELNEGNNWSHTWTGLPEKSGGTAITYTVAETSVPAGYAVSYSADTFTVTNTHIPEVTGKTVTKVWADGDNQDGLRPDAVTVQLKADGQDYGQSVELNQGNNWSHTWTGLPVYKNGQAIAYTVVETSVPQGYSESYSADTFTVTNTHTPEVTGKTVTKIWADGDDQDGLRPDAVTVQLKADGQDYGQSVELNQDNNWSHTWTGLPVYSNGQAIAYTVAETSVPAGYAVSYSADTFTITNTHTPEVTSRTVTKNWADGDDQDGLRPDAVTVQLKADGQNYGQSVELNQDNNWSHTWTGLPVNNGGQPIAYTVAETSVPQGYTQSYSEDTFTITNTHIPELTSRSVTKIWNDSDDQDGLRPDAVTVQLKADGQDYGQSVELNEDNNWSHTWTELPVNSGGQPIAYTVAENPVPGSYSVSYNEIERTFIVTNSYTPGVVSKTVSKVWADGNDQDGLRPASVTVQLMADGESYGDPVELNEDNQWSHTWTGLPEKNDGQTILYTAEETETPEGYAVSYSEDTFTITNTHTPQTTSRTVTKIWNDTDNQDGARPASVTVQLKADGEPYGDPVELNSGNGWSHTWTELPMNSGGEPADYTVQEVSVPAGYTVSYSEDTFTITNSYTPGTVSKTVQKIWADNDNQDGARPASVTVQLMAGGEPYGDPVELNSGNGWSHTWTGLPEKSGGAAIAYTVVETSVPAGYSVSYSADTFTITNSKNAPGYGSLMVTKQNIINDGYLSGAVFDVYRYIDENADPTAGNLTWLAQLTTEVTAANPTGAVGLTGLDPGKYYVMETTPPTGFLDDDTDKAAEVVAGQTVTVAFKNTPTVDIPDEDPPTGDVDENPHTGGSNATAWIVGMLALMLTALGALRIRMKKANRH